jgi:hypothetical protein
METKHFNLSSVENNRLIKIIQVFFGFVCFAVAIFWLIFSLRSTRTERSLWITIIFLAGFGFYQVWSGMGKAARFIETGSEKIIIKKTIFLPPSQLSANEIQKIEVYPFNLIFFLKNNKKLTLRLSTTYVETNEKIKDEVLTFGEENSVNIEFIDEKI